MFKRVFSPRKNCLYRAVPFCCWLECRTLQFLYYSNYCFSFSGVQEENKKLEVLAFEYETDIASLEEELAAAYREKEEVISRNEGMASEIEALSEQLNVSNTELNVLQEEISALVSFCIYLFTSTWFHDSLLPCRL